MSWRRSKTEKKNEVREVIVRQKKSLEDVILELNILEEDNRHIKLPFPKLTSFNASATVLSYLVGKTFVVDYISRLSKNAVRYYFGHRSIVDTFLPLQSWDQLSVISFGDSRQKWVYSYPNNFTFKLIQ